MVSMDNHQSLTLAKEDVHTPIRMCVSYPSQNPRIPAKSLFPRAILVPITVAQTLMETDGDEGVTGKGLEGRGESREVGTAVELRKPAADLGLQWQEHYPPGARGGPWNLRRAAASADHEQNGGQRRASRAGTWRMPDTRARVADRETEA